MRDPVGKAFYGAPHTIASRDARGNVRETSGGVLKRSWVKLMSNSQRPLDGPSAMFEAEANRKILGLMLAKAQRCQNQPAKTFTSGARLAPLVKVP